MGANDFADLEDCAVMDLEGWLTWVSFFLCVEEMLNHLNEMFQGGPGPLSATADHHRDDHNFFPNPATTCAQGPGLSSRQKRGKAAVSCCNPLPLILRGGRVFHGDSI